MLVQKFKFAPILVFQLILLILFFIFVQYDGNNNVNVRGFEDVHVMIFIGFAYLMTFLKKYGYSATGLNWFLAALFIQWGLLCQGFFEMKNGKINLNKKTIMESDIMSATVLITFGALLGVASATQLLFIGLVEIALGCANFYLAGHVFKARDAGGSVVIHTYGAYFGLGASLAMRVKSSGEGHPLNGPSYISDITAMIGSIFLWIYWPSFNSGLTNSDEEYQRGVVNTYLSLASATVTAFVVSSIVNHEPGKFDMVHIQNSTLAGGVGVGAVCNLMIGAGGAVAVGIGAGVLSVLGYRYLTPLLTRLGITDTCGVHNLHGMPGVYSGILSIIFTATAKKSDYGSEFKVLFPVADEASGSTKSQALAQLFALLATLVLAILGGIITGLIAKTKLFSPLKETERYDDTLNWELPHEI